MTDPRYPVGPFEMSGPLSANERADRLAAIAALPKEMRAAVGGLQDEQLDTPYRTGGWTLRQVVHHVADSHINSYCRFRLTVTEDEPTIRVYREDLWGELEDARSAPVDLSLDLLEPLHARWTRLLEGLPEDAWIRRLQHPEMGPMRLENLLDLYAWHGRHHVAHITVLREQKGW